MLTGLPALVAAQTCNRDPSVIKQANLNVPKAVSDRISGSHTATVAVTLDAAGRVTAASIYQSSGYPELDQAAIDAAKHSTYAPGATNCAASGGTFAVEFDYDGNTTVAPDKDCPREARVFTVARPDGAVIRYSGISSPVVVAVVLTIAPDGQLVDARIAQSSGVMALDQAALDAARRSTYEPKMEALPVRRQAGTAGSVTNAGVVCHAVTGKYYFKVTFRPY